MKLNPLRFTIHSVLVLSTLMTSSAMAAEKESGNTPQVTGPVAEQAVMPVHPAQGLPEPLTLESVMALPESISPQVMRAKARYARAKARYDLQETDDNFELDLIGRLGWREYDFQPEDNHLFGLALGKELYDFGRNDAALEAEKRMSAAQNELYEDQKIQFQIRLMQAYFNIILADFQYRIENESMAVAYIAMDKAEDRHELNQLSDVDYLKLQADYEKLLVKRTRASYEQRRTRTNLANLVGRPDALPDKLRFPSLESVTKRSLDDLGVYQKQALASNLHLHSLQLKLQAAESRLNGESLEDMPTFRVDALGGYSSNYAYGREGRWRFDLTMDYPLYDGGVRSAKVSEARAEVQTIQAEIHEYEQSLRDQVADLYFKLQMAEAEKKQNKVFGEYSELYLDYSRALYENESTTDLGDSMVRLSEANYQVIAQQFRETLHWAQLDYLTGKPVELEAYQ